MTPRAAIGAGCLAALLAGAGCHTTDPWQNLYDPEMGWRAKAAGALGEVETPDDVEAASFCLAQAWATEDVPLVRYAIVSAFGRLGTARAKTIAAQALTDADPLVRAAAVRTLGRVGSRAHVRQILERLRGDSQPAVRAAAAAAIADLDDDPETAVRLDDVPALIERLDDDPEVAVAAHLALQRLTQQPLARDRAAWQSWWTHWQQSAPTDG